MAELGSGQASDQPPGTGAGASQGEPVVEGAEQKPFTREEAQALIDAGRDEAVKISGRHSQSLVDKADNRITKRVTAELKSLDVYAADLKAAGHELPPEILERVKQDVIVRSLTDETPEGEAPSAELAGQAALAGDLKGDSAQATGMVAVAMMEEADCFIEKGDAEFPLINLKTASPRLFLASVGKAIDTKQQRLAGASANEAEGGEEERDAGDLSPRARIPSGKKSAPSKIPDGLSPMEYLKRGYSKPK